ncbi:Utp14-domain-containing protein [Mycena floridula]|nr:Utp14-domain-containing protein [Mycena floridula]
MARPGKSNGRTSKEVNASGYAKRQLRKKAAPSGDVYEYTPEKVRRSAVGMDLDADEADEAGGDDDEPLRARLIGEHKDDEMIDSDDDEELDSDAAFEESDDDRFAGFFSKKVKKTTKKKSAVRFADVDLNEDVDVDMEDEENSQDEEDGDDDEFIDVLDILDGRGEPDNPSDDQEDQQEDDDEEEEDEEEDSPAEELSDDETAAGALDELETFISTLDPSSQKRKLPAQESTDVRERPRKRRMLKERTETGLESEFRAHSTDAKLNLDDLLAPLALQSANLTSLKKSATTLASSSKARTLTAPLPQRTQERLDREAAYEQTKEEVDKWKATMKRIQEAEHLSFPLQAKPAGRVSNLELTAKFKPTTALESSVDALLKSAKLREEDIEQTEDSMLQMNNLTVEELRKMRELMFRAEIKAKRVAKIKSKTYRKIKRKERERLGEKADGDEETEEGKMKRDVDRAKERATLRHKNTGKWAKHMKGREGWDEQGRKGIEEMLDRGERLRRKIAGRDSDQSEDDEENEDDEEEVSPETIRQRAFDELDQLDAEDKVDAPAKGSVFEMKFMKDAMARQQQGTDRLKWEVRAVEDEGSGDNVVSRTGGRMVFNPTPQPVASSSKTVEPTEPVGSADIAPPSPPQLKKSLLSAAPETSNPWLVDRDPQSAAKGRKKNEIIVNKDSKDADKSKNKLKKQTKKLEVEKSRSQADATVEISMSKVLSTETVSAKDTDSDIASEVEEQEKMLTQKGKGKGVKGFEQRDLVAFAFAGDNVTKNFAEAKRQEIAADAPKEIDVTIPGWGSWGVKGRFIKKVAGIDPTSRADHNKTHVIISEKRDKKAAKYMVKDLPYPYTSKAQFDRRMEQPLGVEWNTRIGFQRGTLPKVVKRMGTVIDPLEKLF